MEYITTPINENILKIDEFGLGTMYFIRGEKYNALIDTGTGAGHLKSFIDTISDKPYLVLCTHGHVDHVGGIHQFKEVYLHSLDHASAKKIDLKARQNYAKNILKTYPDSPFQLIDIKTFDTKTTLLPLENQQIIDLGGTTLEVIHLPGHTPGSVCFLDKKDQVLFSGDNTQHLELLIMEHENRKEVVEMWLNGLKQLEKRKDEFSCLLGGHEPLEYEVLDRLLYCGQGILDGTILPKKKTIHIFTGEFCSYQNVHITYQPGSQLMR